MYNEFTRGKIIITTVVAIALFINGIGIWFVQTWLLKWYAELARPLSDPAARGALRELQSWFITNQETFFTNRVLNFGMVTFLCLLLYLGHGSLRWLWAVHWLTRGILGFALSIVALKYVGQSNQLLALSFLLSSTYVICAILLFSEPSIRVYMNSMRRPASARRI